MPHNDGGDKPIRVGPNDVSCRLGSGKFILSVSLQLYIL